MTKPSSGLREYFVSAWRTDPAERRLVRKIDFFILSFCCLSYLLNYVSVTCSVTRLANTCIQLDRTNLANAYVSGMKEDLGFQGDQLNHINTCFTVG